MENSPHSVLFCCDYNSVRSPMAEGIFKKLVGKKIFVQSAGVYGRQEIDGFAVKVCSEIRVELDLHKVKSLVDLEKHGGFVGSFDKVIALTPLSLNEIQKYIRFSSVETEFWEIDEPLKNDGSYEETLNSYRKTRDIIYKKLSERFRKFLK